MGTTMQRVEAALERAGLRGLIDSVERNPATPGEVMIWRGVGHPVYSVRKALELACEWASLLDTKEVGDLLGVKRSTVSTYLYRGRMPKPDGRISGQPVWRLETIVEWSNTRPRPGRPRKAPVAS